METLNSLIIKGGIREGFREGTSKLAGRSCYGYTQSSNGELVINETEAKTVFWIFEHYLAGDSLGRIADRLATNATPSPTGNAKWNRQAINKLLSNEKYTGCALLQKTRTEHGRQIRNGGQTDQYMYLDNNPAIISKEMFNAVQEEKLNRSRNSKQTVNHELTSSA